MRFHKIHGAANDFMVIDNRAPADVDWVTAARRSCDRHRGVGADGILLVEGSEVADLRMRLFNADGSEAEMCGNGIRCTAKFVLDTGISTSREVTWETGAGLVSTSVLDTDPAHTMVRVDMGAPRLEAADIPVNFDDGTARNAAFAVDGVVLDVLCVSMGNPHAVAFVTDVAGYPLERVGPLVETHAAFPRRTNFEIAEVVSPDRIRVRVWERGVGETMACGTGACAVAVAGQVAGRTGSAPAIELPGGTLHLEWRPGESVMMTGPAETAFVGEVNL